MCDFYILSGESLRQFEPRACKVIRKFRTSGFGKYFLVSVNPDIPKVVYGTDQDISQLVLQPCDMFISLFKLKRKQWPVMVDVYTLEPDAIRDDVHLDLRKCPKVDMGYLCKTEKDAWEQFQRNLAALEMEQALYDKWHREQ